MGSSGANQACDDSGPSSKDNFERLDNSMRYTIKPFGPRKTYFLQEQEIVEVIKEDPVAEEKEEEMQSKVLEKENPLITTEYQRIIDAAIPKHTM